MKERKNAFVKMVFKVVTGNFAISCTYIHVATSVTYTVIDVEIASTILYFF